MTLQLLCLRHRNCSLKQPIAQGGDACLGNAKPQSDREPALAERTTEEDEGWKNCSK